MLFYVTKESLFEPHDYLVEPSVTREKLFWPDYGNVPRCYKGIGISTMWEGRSPRITGEKFFWPQSKNIPLVLQRDVISYTWNIRYILVPNITVGSARERHIANMLQIFLHAIAVPIGMGKIWKVPTMLF